MKGKTVIKNLTQYRLHHTPRMFDPCFQEESLPFHHRKRQLYHTDGEHGSLGPVRRLPPEILLQIFQYCTRRPGRDDSNWLAFSHVCSLWHGLAVTDSSLWTCPDFRFPMLAEAMIYRARFRPLHIILQCSDTKLLHLVHDRLNLEALNISITESASALSWQEEITRLLSKFLPTLQFLDLRSHYHAFLADFSLLEAPRLRSVTLHNWLPNWNLSFMRNLTSLSVLIDSVGFDRHAPQQPPRLLDILQGNPGLTHLMLEGVFWRRDLELPETERSERLRMPHLKHLKLQDDVALIDRLLRLVDLPGLESLNIQAELCTENATPELLSLCGSLRCLLCYPQWITLETMSWELGPSMKVKVWDRRGIDFSLTVMEDCRPSELKAFSKTLFLSLPLNHITVLQAHISDPSCKPLLYPWMALSTLPELATIEFTGPGCRAFEGLLGALVPTCAIPGLQVSEPFPALRQLTLSHLKMYRKVLDRSPYFWQLDSFLTDRRKRGRPVPQVELLNCIFAAPLTKLLSTKCVRIKEPLIVLPQKR